MMGMVRMMRMMGMVRMMRMMGMFAWNISKNKT